MTVFWIVAAVVAAVVWLVHQVVTAPLEDGYYSNLDRADGLGLGICGASNGELVCTLRPHPGRLHLDETRGSMYHSATFTVKEVTR